ncbi:DUF4097 family beta strand repeat-containing protein [Microbacterium sp. YY-01]|uniref:DUF4097 family beta strand repeat-containing protein n=1 Tax=Microbacterium sp. YY-01 TaxID=3421634 RepID=UPI003D167F2C
MNEKWLITPGETRTISIEQARKVKASLAGGQIDVIAHDEPHIYLEVHSVTGHDLRIECDGKQLTIDHPQTSWDNILRVFRSFTSDSPRAHISLAVPRTTALTLGVVSAQALISGLHCDARLNAVSGELIIDHHTGDIAVNTVSGDVHVRAATGTLLVNAVSGDVTATGQLRRITADTVSGAVLIDAVGTVDSVSINTISGASTVQLDNDYAANYVLRTMNGRITVDGSEQNASGPTSYTAQKGELAGSFVDLRANSVTGAITVLRRAADTAEPTTTVTEEN